MQLRRKSLRRIRVKCHIRIPVHRIMPEPIDIAALVRHRKILLLQLPKHDLILWNLFKQHRFNRLKASTHRLCHHILVSEHQIYAEPQHRKRQNQNNPGHFKRSVLVLGVNA